MKEFDLKNKIINGDSLKELKKIPDETFDLVFADPPYNLQLKNKLTRPDRSKLNQFAFHLSNPLTVYFRNIFLKKLVKNKKFLESYLGKIYR